MVAVGLDIGKELRGFDYNDEQAVAEQFARVTSIIDKYKSYPRVLTWVIANEPNLLFDDEDQLKPVNPKVYDALNDIVEYIHEHDPNHPVSFSLAGANAKFGPTGHWEMPTTSWGREIEEPSAIKAQNMALRIRQNILNDTTGKLIGSFAFFWGQKQERTPTWYGMFNASGEQTARIDELTKIWTGKYPKNRAPLSTKITLNKQLPMQSVVLTSDQEASAKVYVIDPNGDALTTEWVLRKEVTSRSQGGHFEPKPRDVKLQNIELKQVQDGFRLSFRSPKEKGEYRLFAYTYDGKGKVGNANFPFLVQ